MVRQEIKSFVMDSGEFSGLVSTAPCSLYSVLFESGAVPDPSVSDNAAKLAKYSGQGCTFTAEFEITPLIIYLYSFYDQPVRH